MAKIKKAYQEIVDLLEANPKSKVADILPQVISLAEAKAGAGGGKASAFHRDDAGNVVAIKCYYHKLWMDPRVVEFGAKASSPTGFNSMCKDGVSKWTSQQRKAKQAESELLTRLTAGEITVEDLPKEQERIKQEATAVIPREDGYGFETLEECLADSESRG